MLMFIAGFGFCAFLVFMIYLYMSWGFWECVEDNELAIAVYKNKSDVWEVSRNLEKIADLIEHRRKFGKPGSIKYID
ncbi:hypothetical protein PQ125_002660 [Salmonella enterica]|nr:hypothetical protein [Salmonella enterica]